MAYKRWKKRQYRLKGFDYRNEGWYFVTICTKNRHHFFGKIVQKKMCLSDIGQICHDYWLDIPNHFEPIELGEMVVMPNHIHGVVGLFYPDVDPLDSTVDPFVGSLESNEPTMSEISPKSGSLSHIIRTYKAACTHMIRQITDLPFAWQSRFHDRIIRNEDELQRIENYIKINPLNWKEDSFFTDTK